MWILLFLLPACSPSADAPESASFGKGDGFQRSVLEFDANFEETASGPVIAGETVVVRYAPERLSECRSSNRGTETWGITGFVLAGQGTLPRPFAVTELHGDEVVAVDAVVEIPETDHIEIYFQVSDIFGCTAFDSDFGANYRFDVETPVILPSAVIAYDVAGEPEVSGDLLERSLAVIHYEPERLSICRASQGGMPQWGITGFLRDVTGEVRSFSVAEAENGELVARDPSVRMPEGSTAAMWFEATSVTGCHQRDPLGGSYDFALAAAP